MHLVIVLRLRCALRVRRYATSGKPTDRETLIVRLANGIAYLLHFTLLLLQTYCKVILGEQDWPMALFRIALHCKGE